MAGVNALLLGTLMYRSGLVPRIIPAAGADRSPAAPPVTIATIFGLTEHGSPAGWIVAAPIASWEFSLGVYLVVKGFKPPSPAGMCIAGASAAQRTPLTGRMATAPLTAQTPATRTARRSCRRRSPGWPARSPARWRRAARRRC